MSGICGFILLNHGKKGEEKISILNNMLHTITHRGPDKKGIFFDDKVYLGANYLKISNNDTEKIPFIAPDGNYIIAYDGRIYNHKEIEHFLTKQNYPLKNKSDGEIILYSYIHWGIDFVKQLNGDFAIAIWDKNKNRLILVRDRIGIKPLFYYLDKEKLVFGSEIKSLLAHPNISRDINPYALYYHFILNYIPENQTLFNNILHLPPANMLILENEKIKLHKYWDISHSIKYSYKHSHDYEEEFLNLFKNAVRLRLVDDIQLGVFLSGGLDSSSVTAITSKDFRIPINTFSIGFSEKSYDESYYSKMVANHLKTTHHHMLIKEDVENILPKIIYHMEEPTADSSAVPMYYLSNFTKKHVNIVLAGDGSDEIAAGYETHTATLLANMLRFVPKPIINTLHKLIKLLPPSHEKYALREKLERFLRGMKNDIAIAHFTWRNITEYDYLPLLFSKDFYSEKILMEIFQTFQNTFNKFQNSDTLTKALYSDVFFYLPGDSLIKVDRMSMANSLEVRTPFLDYRMVEFFFQVPSNLKLKKLFNKKYLIKKSMESMLPKEIIKRKKVGFTVPIGSWFLTSLRELTGDLINSDMTKSISFINQNFLRKVFSEHTQKRHNHGYTLWSILIFLLWYKKFIYENDAI